MTPRSGLSVLFDLFVADSAARSLLAPVMGPTGLTATQYAEYSIVSVEGPLSVTGFADVARLPLTTASDTLRAMERRGHVSRFRDPRDGRARLVDLTPDGREAHSTARRAFRMPPAGSAGTSGTASHRCARRSRCWPRRAPLRTTTAPDRRVGGRRARGSRYRRERTITG